MALARGTDTTVDTTTKAAPGPDASDGATSEGGSRGLLSNPRTVFWLRVAAVVVKRPLLGGARHRRVTRGFPRASAEVWAKRKETRIGIPRVLNL